jgi:hypothetical protein
VTYEELIRGYCAHVGIADVPIGKDDAVFELDDFPINVRHDKDFNRVSLWSEIAALRKNSRPEIPATILQMCMTLALNGGYSLAANEHAVYCMHSIPVSNLTVDNFDQALAMLLMKASALKELLAAEHEAAMAADQPRSIGSDCEVLIRI